ncbi:OmpA family protein [Leptospira congkakensis]|uniref:OmpA family protein n=1 Tax=Leptospira congkakensis TaxID=2484932 RepID=A0A4Z1A6S2_9LEPT|nr:OmpA family protein [Leptospira congkakensis]TGL86609.1 OmpA family protein [Leptospira congkakensis]TGL93846.1 OmpA family protein [Leptospira congkakensis]TGL94748.1 OmpA family protein [Leptospira congkakensis]
MPYSFFPKLNSNRKPNLRSSDALIFKTPIVEGRCYTQYGYPAHSGDYAFCRKETINDSYANLGYSHSHMDNIDGLAWGNRRSAYISESITQWKKKTIQYMLNLKFSFVSLYLFLSFFVLFSHPVYSQRQGSEPSLVVAPIQGPINTEFQEFGPTMTPDAKTLYFYSKRSSKGYTEIFKSERKKDGTWDFPEEVDVLNSPFDDQSPFISRDGKTLLLSSNRDGSVEVMLPDGKVGISRDLYVSNWNGKEWGNPVALPSPINTEDIEENPHLLGDTLLFTRYPFGKPNLAKVYYSQYKDDKWSTPKLLPSPINDNYATIAAAFNDDGSILFFSSNRPGGYGGFDLYMAKIDGDSFKDIENFGAPINSSEDEAYIVFQQVKKTFLFCRRVDGRSFDLFTASVPKQENIVQKKLEETKKISLDSVYFERASSVLKPESSVPLDAIVDYLHENSDKRMKIIGHTDLTGTFEDNMVLSKERADSVKQYLVSKGVDPKRLVTDGKGPTQPVVQGTDESSSKKNRRTEFVLTDP